MSFEFHINGNQTTFFILFVLRSCTFGFADYISTRRGETGGRTSTTSRVQETNKSRHKANSIFFIAIRIYMYKKRKGRKETTRSAPTRPPALFPFDNK